MTWLDAKVAKRCPRCRVEHNADTVLCPEHARDAAARTAKHNNAKRIRLRAKRRCAMCGCRSRFYRCASCYLALKLSRTLGSEGVPT
jgi:hypothetical protein